MAYEQILAERRGPVTVLTLNRPEKLNAWTATMSAELREAIQQANADPDVAVIVLTGAGRGFCAGADISNWNQSFQRGSGPSTGGGAAPRGDSWVHLLQQSKPVIAAVNGVAVGIGLTQVLPADIRIAGESARFGAVFAKMGVVPELASTYFLAQIVGLGAALEMCLTARMVDAAEAKQIGLVSRVVPDAQLMEEALTLANSIAALPPTQLQLAKRLFSANAVEQDLDAVISREGEALGQAYASPEFREAVTAFMEKRQPDFRAVIAR